MSTFFSADWHLMHANILVHCNRPFNDTGEMNNTIINNINAVVGPDDWLHFLGDLALTKNSNIHHIKYLLSKINCKNLTWILGNHDEITEPFKDRFRWIKDVNTINVNGQKIFLSHYAHRVWAKSHKSVWHLYGHSHGSLPDDPNSMSFDVGVDCHGYKPVSFDRVKELMSKKTFKPVDHHKERH